MRLFNVTVFKKTTMVVVANDEDEAFGVAYENADRGFEDGGEVPHVNVTGEISSRTHLRDGWDSDCVPYGGDGNTRIGAFIDD